MFSLSLRLHSKRARLALRFFTYGVMTLATVVLTTLAIFYALGYRFNQSTQTFEQGGLVQFRSAPEGATVVVDGKVQNFSTPGRAVLPSGTHTVSMQLNGYREWQRTISLAPGQLLWLNYTRFIPSSITTVPLKVFGSMASVLPSPDHRWMLIQQKAEVPAFTLVDFNDEKNPTYTDFTLPDPQLTRVDGHLGQFSVTEWSLDSRFFLIHHVNGNVSEWLRVDRSKPDAAQNISQLFGLNISLAHFAGSNSNLIFAKTDSVLRRLDVGGNSATGALVDGVQDFSVYGDDTIAFSASRQSNPGDPNTAQEVVGLYKGDKETVAQTMSANIQPKIAFGEYDNHNYLAIYKGAGEVQVLRDPASGTKDNSVFTTFAISKPLQWIMFSNNGRMVVCGEDHSITTYDIELDKIFQSDLTFLSSSPSRPLKWLDDFYLWSDVGDRLHIFEFDGQNDREITTVSSGFDVNLSQSGQTLFSIGKNSVTNTYFLQASKLVK